MKISTKGRYAARAMLELALQQDTNAVPLKSIADAQDISVKYLEKIMTSLAAAGLVRSSRGKTGGFFLGRSASDIGLVDIVRTVEGDIVPVHCLDGQSHCSRADTCVTRHIWKSVQSAVVTVLSSYTLADMVRLGSVPGTDYTHHTEADRASAETAQPLSNRRH